MLIMITAGITACKKSDSFRPVYYPSQNDLTVYTRGPSFDNKEQAKQWAEDQHRQRRDLGWTYEIGKNCRPLQDSDMEVCEETLQ